MSCCGGSCVCSSGCKSSNGCGGYQMYPDTSYSEKTTTEAPIVGVASHKTDYEGSEMGVGAENVGCKCGSDCKCGPGCTCDPCACN